ncbi:MAG: cell wall hydrolase [Nisaea sp.]|uniref:cell wall hydrolase n=1 Tax=Nisaea sp. TaxID=2024842 RepID=UPI00329910C8
MADQPEDVLDPSDFIMDGDQASLQDEDAKGLALRWSTLWMSMSRKASQVADGLPIPAIRIDESALSPAAKRRAAMQRRAAVLARARAHERAIAAQRSARLAGLAVSTALGGLLLCATPSQSSLPEFTEFTEADASILLTPMERTSVHAASVEFDQPVASSGVLTSNPGKALKTASKGADGDFHREVNRGIKADLLMTRSRAVASEPNPDLPHSGNIFELRDLFSSVDEMALPRTVLAAPGWPSKGQIALATNHFNAPGILRERSRTMVADAKKARPATVTATPSEQPLQVAVAYAPVENMEEFKSPFAAVLNIPGEAKSPDTAVGDAAAAAKARDRKEIKVPGDVKTASLVATSLSKPKQAAPTKSKVTIAGVIPMIKPDISAVPKKDSIATVAVVRPKLGTKDHWWAKNKIPRAAFSRREQRCLAAAVYFEARGEPVAGQAAVAQVVLNRVKAPAYPSTICGVVYQNKKWRNRCQFSFACDGIRDKVTDKKSYAKAAKVAKSVTRGKSWSRVVGSSTHYHATYVNPRWAKKMKRLTKIGRHIFYQTHKGGWS